MKIGIVTTWFERGAAYVSRQYKNSLESSHEVYIYARGGERYAIGDKDWDSDKVTWGKGTDIPIATAVDLADFQRWIERCELDVVFFNEQHWWEPVLLCNKLGVISGAYIDYYTEETIPLFGCYDFLICNTKRHYSVFDWHPSCFYIPWGTDTSLFVPHTHEPVVPGMVTFFHSGGVSPDRKGTDILLDSFTQLRGPCQLIIHAQRQLKEYFPQLRTMIEQLEGAGKLICYEETVAAPGLYTLGDVYVYPSKLDGIGLTIAEALASGLPVITSDYPPMNEFVNDFIGKKIAISKVYARADGYYWPQCLVDSESLTCCMQSYIDNIHEIPKIKILAREYAEQYLNWGQNSQSLSDIFRNVTKRPKEKAILYEEMAWDFEERRKSLGQRHPIAYSLAKFLWRRFKGAKNIFTKS